MRYPCIGQPHCMKTFEYGHALRAHVASCLEAQKKLKEKSKVENLEQEIATEYNGILNRLIEIMNLFKKKDYNFLINLKV
jgi:hypothetical protein